MLAAILGVIGLLIFCGVLFGIQHMGPPGETGPITPNPTVAITPPAAPDLSRDVVLAGSNTIGGDLAGPLLAAFARSSGAQGTATAAWRAPDSWVRGAEARFTTEKLKKCLLNVKTDDQMEVSGGPMRLISMGLGSGCAAPLLDAGYANVGMASHPIDRDVQATYTRLGPWTDEGAPMGAAPRHEHVIAMDGVVVIANPDNKPKSLTKDTLRRLFQRESGATNWMALGGPDLPVKLFSRENVSGTYETFRDLVLDKKDLDFDPNGVNGPKALPDNEKVVDAVRTTPGAIGFVGLEYAAKHPELVVPISECGLVYTPAGEGSQWMIKTEDYPLARRLFLYTPEAVRGKSISALQFIDFVKSPAGQKAIQQANYVSLTLEKVSDPVAGELRRAAADLKPDDPQLAARYRDLTTTATQLTTTIRFGFNEVDLDARALDDVGRVVTFMKRGDNARATLIIAGFADGMGPADPLLRRRANREKAFGRAAAVAEAFRRRGVAKVQALAFGSEAPVGCNGPDDEVGRRKNRRVELWLR
jgi:phosphate transport system substrate-binding protein